MCCCTVEIIEWRREHKSLSSQNRILWSSVLIHSSETQNAHHVSWVMMAHRLHMPHTWPLDSLAQRGAGLSFPILWTYGYGISGYLVAPCQLSGCCAVKWLTLQGVRVVQDTMRRTFLWGVVLTYVWSTVLDIMHCLRLTPSKWTSHLSADTSCQNGRAGTVNNIKLP